MKRINRTFITGMPAMLIALALVFGMAGCEEVPETRGTEEAATEEAAKQKEAATEAAKKLGEEAAAKQALWEAKTIYEYDFNLDHSKGEEAYWTKAHVRGTDVVYSEKSLPATGEEFTGPFPFEPLAETVAELYAAIKEAAANGTLLEVIYDSSFDFPGQVNIGGQRLMVSNFANPRQATVPDTPEADGFDFDRHKAEKAAWEALNIQSYKYTGELILGVPTKPVTVTVTPDGTKVEESAETDEHWNYFYKEAISDIFDAIAVNVKEYVLDMESINNRAVKFRIEYDEEHHYPAYFVSIMYDKEGGELLDGGGGGVKITDFTKLTN